MKIGQTGGTLLLVISAFVFLVGMAASLFNSNVERLALIDLIAIFFLFAPILVLFFTNMQQQPGKIVFTIIIAYFVFAYFLKSILIINWPFQIKSFSNVSYQEIREGLAEAYFYVSLFVLSFAFLMPLVKRWITRLQYPSNEFLVIDSFKSVLFIILVLAVKFFSHYVFYIGVPGVEPKMVFPGVTGVLAFISRLGAFFIVNYYLIYAFIMDGRKKNKWLASLFVMSYVGMDLSIGVKFSIVYQMIVFGFIASSLFKDKKIKVPHFIMGSVFIVFALISFKYINYYRFGLLHGLSGLEALSFALNSSAAQEKYFVIEIANRITGVENFLVALQISKHVYGSMVDVLWNGALGKEITQSITGVADAVNAVGITQIGAVYIVAKGNPVFFLVLSFFYMLVSLLFFSTIFIKTFGTSLEKDGFYFYEVFLAIFFIYFLFGSGGLWFFLKEAAVSCGMVWFFVRFTGMRSLR